MKQRIKRTRSKASRRARSTRKARQTKFRPPRTANEFFMKPKAFQETWKRVTRAVSMMRDDGVSLAKASREVEIGLEAIIRLGGSALQKRANGRYAAKPFDRLLRVLVIPISGELNEIATRDSREATKLSRYWIALHKYVDGSDTSAITSFKGQSITDTKGIKVPLLTNRAELNHLGSAGEFSFETIYAYR